MTEGEVTLPVPSSPYRSPRVCGLGLGSPTVMGHADEEPVPAIHVEGVDEVIPPTPTGQSTPGDPWPALESVLGQKLAAETLAHALERGSTSQTWLAREQLKFWALEEKAAKLFRTLKRDYSFAQLVLDAKAVHRARLAFLNEKTVAERQGDHHRVHDANSRLAELEEGLKSNLARRNEWDDWRFYKKLSHELEIRLHAMRAMWQEHERTPFECAWKGEYGHN